MKRVLAVLVAIAAVVALSDNQAQAQNFVGGYQFGAGLQSNCGGGLFRGGYAAREQPPYFALYPPVYYSHIVPRPYGISPFAAPAGIAPVELSVPVPISIKNPHFDSSMETVSEINEASDVEAATGEKTTFYEPILIHNPFVDRLGTEIVGVVR